MDAEIIEQIDTIDVCFDEPTELEVEVAISDINLQPLSVTKNGTYTTPQGVNGFDTVKVSVLPTTEEKTLTVTENGNYTVLPTEADTLSKVEVEVEVWNKISPTTISWRNQSTLTEIPNMRALDISKITDMTYMFGYCSSLKELDVSGWDTSNVTNMYCLFYGCSSLQQLDVSGWDTSKITNISWMFGNCSKLTTIDLSNWDCGKVTNTKSIFDSCSSLKTFIGNHTLAEVEASTIVALKDCGRACTDLQYQGAPLLHYSSLLALVNGAYDRSSMAAATLHLSNTAFSNCRNDDDTIPDADTLAERQAKIRAICAEKNYTLSLG